MNRTRLFSNEITVIDRLDLFGGERTSWSTSLHVTTYSLQFGRLQVWWYGDAKQLYKRWLKYGESIDVPSTPHRLKADGDCSVMRIQWRFPPRIQRPEIISERTSQ